MKKYRDLTPEEWWEISDNLTPEDIMNGEVDHFLDDNYFWRQIEYEHPDLVSFLDNRFAIINKEYGLEKLHKLSKQHPRKKWEQSIAWYNHENNQKQNENKNMAKNNFRLTESKLKQIVAESVKKVLTEKHLSSKTVFDGVYGRNVNKRSGILRLENGGCIVLYDLIFTGNSIIGTNRENFQKIEMYISATFGRPLNGSNIPNATEDNRGIITVKNVHTKEYGYGTLTVDDYYGSPEEAAENDYYSKDERD